MAISFTIIRIAITSVPDYTVLIQETISEQLDIKLEIGILDAEIHWLVPRLNLIDVNIYDKSGKQHLLHLDEIDLSLDWSGSLQTMMPVVGEVSLIGLNIQLGVSPQSQLMIQDYVIQENIDVALQTPNNIKPNLLQEISDEIKYAINNLDFKILDSQIHLYDNRYKKRSKTLRNFNLQLLNSGDEHTFEVKANLPEYYGKFVHLIIDINGDLFDYRKLSGEMYLSVEDLNAAPWLDDYWEDLRLTANARINAQTWLNWKKQEITEVQSRLSLSDVAVHYLANKVNTWKIEQLDALARWKKQPDGWDLDIRDLVSVRDGTAWPQPSAATIKMRNQTREIKLLADFLRIEGLAYLVSMAGNLADQNELVWLKLLNKHKPTGDLKQLDVSVSLDELEEIKINTQFSHIGMSFPGSDPEGVSNLRGEISYKDKTTWLSLNSENTEVRFNELFRNPIVLSEIKGKLEISHINKEWNLKSNDLSINSPHISTRNRFNFMMQDGGRPFLDLTTLFKDGDGKYTGLYLPAGVMGKQTLKWLDRGISKGNVVKGGYQFYGYLNELPFRQNQGISLVDFDVSEVDLLYLEEWPIMRDIDAHLRIENDTLLLQASDGHLFNSKVIDARVYLDNFISPTLDIKGNVDAELKDIKQFVTASSLRESVPDYIDNVQLDGKGELALEFFMPLYGDYKVEWGAELFFKDGEALFEKENYKLTDIKGSIRSAGETVESSQLKAKLEAQPVDIGIKTSRNQESMVYDINLSGHWSADSLLSPVPEIKNYFSGEADWDIILKIISEEPGSKTSVEVKVLSDLLGVESELMGLLKPADSIEPMDMDISILPGQEISYSLKLGDHKKLRLRDTFKQWYVSGETDGFKGKAVINRKKDIDMPIKIDLEFLDLNKFVGIESQFDEEQSEKIHKVLTDEERISPRVIPSLELKSKMLTWKKFNFTNVDFVSQQSKLGMIINKFTLDANDYDIGGKGSWLTGRNNQHKTDIEMNIRISDLGSAFKEIELTDKFTDASGKAYLRWHWQGAPYEFGWEKLRGDGNLSLKDGTIDQVDAGAGRILGLFNFRTLLSLDFGNQVSEGFTFDKVNGSFSFSDGNVYTDDFLIESKVADVLMRGRLGIADETVDQKVTVRPHLGATVTLGTAVVAGPAAGGIIYLFQKIFNTDRLSEYQYTMKGNIDNPDVELISAPETEQGEEAESDF